jgi:hypothetical protein
MWIAASRTVGPENSHTSWNMAENLRLLGERDLLCVTTGTGTCQLPTIRFLVHNCSSHDFVTPRKLDRS